MVACAGCERRRMAEAHSRRWISVRGWELGIDGDLGKGDHRGGVNGLEVLPHRLWVRQWRIRPVLCLRISSAECCMARQTHWDRRLEQTMRIRFAGSYSPVVMPMFNLRSLPGDGMSVAFWAKPRMPPVVVMWRGAVDSIINAISLIFTEWCLTSGSDSQIQWADIYWSASKQRETKLAKAKLITKKQNRTFRPTTSKKYRQRRATRCKRKIDEEYHRVQGRPRTTVNVFVAWWAPPLLSHLKKNSVTRMYGF